MRLLLDQNLSARLLAAIEPRYPGSSHVLSLGLDRAEDEEIWNVAARDGWVIVSKDTDFYQRSVLFGHPPKVIWLAAGNSTTRAIASLLEINATTVAAFLTDAEQSFLALG